MNIWLHNILCDLFYPFKTQVRIILGHTVLLLNSVHIALLPVYKNKNRLWLIYLHILTGPTAVVHRNESVLKNIFKRGYKEIRDRKLLEILKKDRTWLKKELHCNVKTPAPLFFQNNLNFVIQMLINVFPRIIFCSNIFFCT